MWQSAVAGVVLGLSAGVAPGPLMAVAVGQTVRYGVGEGLKVAVVPPITDVPLILLATWLLHRAENVERLLGVIAIAGAGVLAWLGAQSLFGEPAMVEAAGGTPGSLRKGLAVNLLSPHPYLFWFSVGVPLMVTAAAESIWSSIAFAMAFFACLCGSKVVIVLLVARSRGLLRRRGYRLTVRALGAVLIGFAVVTLVDGLQRF